MDEFLLIAAVFLLIGTVTLALGKMHFVADSTFIPLFLSSFIFAGFYCVKVLSRLLIPLLGFSSKTTSLLFYNYGNGLLGLLPLALLILFVGKYVLKMNYNEQWSGSIRFTLPSLMYGLIAGVLLSAVPLIIAVSTGQKLSHKIDVYRDGLNCITNLYEEIICRGLLLACCIKYWNKLFAVLLTSVVFGFAHGLNEKSITVAMAACLMAWAVLKAKNLWAGWTSHQIIDMIVDTFSP